jgi:DNA-binding beta-propeller fold protein YncE
MHLNCCTPVLLLGGTYSNFSSAAAIPKSFTVGPQPSGIVFNPSNGLLYVPSAACDTRYYYEEVSMINPNTGRVTTVPLPKIAPSFGSTYDAQYKEIYIAIVSGSSGWGGLCSIVYDSKNERLYATCNNLGMVFAIRAFSPTNATLTDWINTGQDNTAGITYTSAMRTMRVLLK